MNARAEKGKTAERNSPDWRAQFVPRWIQSWTVHHPHWTHVMWDETTILKLAKEMNQLEYVAKKEKYCNRCKKIYSKNFYIVDCHLSLYI